MPNSLLKMNQRELILLLAGVSAVFIAAIVVTFLLPNAKAMAAAKKDVQLLQAL